MLNDLQDAKEKLKKEQEKWKKEKNKLELDVNQKTEKLRSMDANRGLRQSEVAKNLSTEKEQLITEKHKLSDDVNKVIIIIVYKLSLSIHINRETPRNLYIIESGLKI